MKSRQLSLNLKFYKVDKTNINPTDSKPKKLLKISSKKAKDYAIKKEYLIGH